MRIVTAMSLACLAWSASLQAQIATQGFAFTYQGEMHYLGQPVNDQCDMTFSVYDEITNGVQLGSVSLVGVQIVDGTFTTKLEYGDIYDGIRFYLEIAIAAGCGAVGAGAETLARTAITSAPYSSYALTSRFSESVDWTSILGKPAGLDNGDDDTLYSAGAGLVLTGNDFSIDDSYRLPQTCNSTDIATWNGATWACAADADSTNFWSLGGNTGTTAASNYLGTTDNQAFEIRVNNVRALRIEPTLNDEPNLIGGYIGNNVSIGVRAATIGGGGITSFVNSIGANYGTVSGGYGSSANGEGATVSGGISNSAVGSQSTVAGGQQNSATGIGAAVTGGIFNSAEGFASTVGGVGAVARLRGQQAHASGRFVSAGESQTSTYTLLGTTTSATPLSLLTHPSQGTPLTIPENMTMTFDLQIVATISGAQDYFGYMTRGVAQNDSSTIFFNLDAPPFSGGFGSGAWSVVLSADSVGDSLKIEVIGEAGKTIRWVATVRTTEVIFP